MAGERDDIPGDLSRIGLAEPQPLNHGPVRSLGGMRTACVLPFAMR
jgi:hypothetical protein